MRAYAHRLWPTALLVIAWISFSFSASSGSSMVGELGADTFLPSLSDGLTHFLLLYDPQCEISRKFIPHFDAAARVLEGKVKFWKINGLLSPSIENLLHVSDYPTVFYLRENTLQEYLSAFQANSLVLYHKYAFWKKSKATARDFTSITDESITNIQVEVERLSLSQFCSISSTEERWLILFYAPWCGHCKRLLPTWNAVRGLAKGKPFHVGKVDCTLEATLCHAVDVKGYPSIKIVSKGKLYDYGGRRTIEEFTRFAEATHLSVDGREISDTLCSSVAVDEPSH